MVTDSQLELGCRFSWALSLTRITWDSFFSVGLPCFMIAWYLNSALSTPGLLEGLTNVYALVQARVEALGGQILFWNGVRVMGVLAVSRSIGDHCMRPFVIPDPEVHLPDPFVSFFVGFASRFGT